MDRERLLALFFSTSPGPSPPTGSRCQFLTGPGVCSSPQRTNQSLAVHPGDLGNGKDLDLFPGVGRGLKWVTAGPSNTQRARTSPLGSRARKERRCRRPWWVVGGAGSSVALRSGCCCCWPLCRWVVLFQNFAVANISVFKWWGVFNLECRKASSWRPRFRLWRESSAPSSAARAPTLTDSPGLSQVPSSE